MIIALIFSLIIGIILGLIIFLLLSRRLSPRQDLPVENLGFLEAEAEKVLKNAGFEIREKQKRRPLLIYIDDKSHLLNIAADFWVVKDNRRYAVKVKTGLMADATDPATHRQMLEYDYVFNPDGLLLLDMQNGELHEISYKLPREEKESFLIILIALFIIVFIVGIIWLLIKLKLF